MDQPGIDKSDVSEGGTRSAVEFVDRFTDDRPPGGVIGSSPFPGVVRGGVDVERVIAVDHGAMRISPLIPPGGDAARCPTARINAAMG